MLNPNQQLALLKNTIPVLGKYIESANNFYKLFDINLENALFNREELSLSFDFIFSKNLQAYEDVVHGGAIATIIDSICGVTALVVSESSVFTKELTIVYNKKLKPDKLFYIKGIVIERTDTNIIVQGTILDKEQTEYVRATVNMVIKDINQKHA